MSCPTVIVDNIPLSVVPKQRYLDLVFDECLTWSHHITKVSKSTYVILFCSYILSKHKHVIKEDLLKTLTESLVLSHLTYYLPVCMGSFIVHDPNILYNVFTESGCPCL